MKLLFAVLLLISSLAFSQTDTLLQKPTPQVIDLKQYKMTVPLGWKVKEGCIDEKCMMISPNDTLTSYDRFTENVSITINKLSSASYSADMYANFSKGYLPKVVSNFMVLDRKRFKSNDVRLIYRGDKDGYNQTWMQHYIVKNSKVYIITFSMETEKYDYFRPLIEPYLSTFVLK